jgi:hypothetical protein
MIDLTKPIRTRDGCEVEIVRSDLNSYKPIGAVITLHNGQHYILQYYSDGIHKRNRPNFKYDLFNVEPKKEAIDTNKYRLVNSHTGIKAKKTFDTKAQAEAALKMPYYGQNYDEVIVHVK